MYIFAVALRYLTRRPINLFPAGAISVGVAGLVCLFSLRSGFEEEYRKALAKVAPDIEVNIGRFEPESAEALDEFLAEIEAADEIVAVSPAMPDVVQLEYRTARLADGTWATNSIYVRVQYIDFDRERRVVDLEATVITGADAFRSAPGPGEGHIPIMVGSGCYEEIVKAQRADDGSDRPSADSALVRLVYLHFEKKGASGKIGQVVAAFRTGFPQADWHRAYIPLEWARAKFEWGPHSFISLHVRVSSFDSETIQAAQRHIEAVAGAHGVEKCRFRKRGRYGEWVLTTFDRIVVLLVVLLILAGGFTLVAVMMMSVMSKKRDVGILTAIGSSRKGIACVFLAYGGAVGAMGALVGAVAALAILLGIDTVNWLVLCPAGVGQSTYGLNYVPWAWSWKALFAAAGVSVAVGLVSAVVPAWKAARLDPVKAIRNE